MPSLGKADKLLHCKERDNTCQHPQSNNHVLHVIVTMLVTVIMMMGVVPGLMITVPLAVIMGGNGMRDEMEKGITQEAA